MATHTSINRSMYERLPNEELEKESARKTQLSSQNDDAQREEMFHPGVL